MLMQLVQLSFDKILQARSYTSIVLKAEDKKFSIYVDPLVGKTLQAYLTDASHTRPQTHELITSIFKGLDVKVKQVVINDLQDTTFHARLFLEQMRGDIHHIIEVDARPSDCIILALMHNTPVYCAREVLEKTIPVIE